jgi:ubiquinone/menaquinone biosynthesis C-methylase UbiE
VSPARCYPAVVSFPYAWLDPWVARRPFEGWTARRYARDERPAFGDLDERLLHRLHPELSRAERVLDLGSGTGQLAARIAAAHPRARVVAVEPSATYTRRPLDGVRTLRARGESLPLADASVDVAICLSSLRHLRDRGAALAELRRVVKTDGAAWILELDPEADRARSDRHRRALGSRLARATFDPFLLRSGPTRRVMAALALGAGWRVVEDALDPLQPLYLLRLR